MDRPNAVFLIPAIDELVLKREVNGLLRQVRRSRSANTEGFQTMPAQDRINDLQHFGADRYRSRAQPRRRAMCAAAT
jgi:hypothetical protein